MKASKTSNNEDEKFSYWDYIDKRTLIAIILILSFGCLVVGVVYVQLAFPPQEGEQPEEPDPFHMGLPSGNAQNFTWGNITYPLKGG